jgi:dihydroxy-acid dehydratase
MLDSLLETGVLKRAANSPAQVVMGGVVNDTSSQFDVGELTCTGLTLGENIAGAKIHDGDVIRTPADPIRPDGGLVVLRGNLAPDGAVIKANAADPRLLQHTGRALVFEDYNDMAARIDDPDLDVDADSVLILRNAGPLGGPGMPEWGMLPIPKKLLKAGVRDMVRISDARMSGTSYGTCVLHVAPESWIGGPLALVHTGDLVTLDVPARRLDLQVPETEMAARRSAWTPAPPRFTRGFGMLFSRHVSQANEGCDFDFLEGTQATPEPEIH